VVEWSEMAERKPMKVGVYIPGNIVEKLTEIMKEIGVESLSRVVQESIRLYIAEHSWRTRGEVVGAIGVLYDHEAGNVDEELTDIQHEFLQTIISATHIHLDERNCLLIIIIRGPAGAVKGLVSRIEKVRGVKLVRHMLMAKP